jgi:DNA-binding transcriptional ArsR family regulator
VTRDDYPQQPHYAAAGELLRALAAPLRIAIVTELGDGERCVHELVDALGVSQPLVSQHLRVLRSAGVVRGQRRGREIAYTIADAHVAHIVADAVSHAREPTVTAPAHAGPDAGRQPDGTAPDPAEPPGTHPDSALTDGTARGGTGHGDTAQDSTAR